MTTTDNGAAFGAASATIARAVEDIIATRDLDAVGEADIANAIAALGKLYAAKVERMDKVFPPVTTDALTATQTVILVSELLRAADLNVFDLAMWFRRAS
ncbi:hypothetical protein GCM10011321_33610 [Youhaiella tibetensis]|uniref:Uncharacterized protein n=1 Tax=Paradevosia tibetensis TaxID=1447062 RepID=A0A5B9DI31_9HYPH|nr:hypothetical protein [Youhaiella tibetensis]QEE18696.1 hypothetical protein FNA67_00205 [Youhaiella tibetensis]GGF40041.1 hypothetical protein GCM10011321_33610 [Youhaiella tibetensis]